MHSPSLLNFFLFVGTKQLKSDTPDTLSYDLSGENPADLIVVEVNHKILIILFACKHFISKGMQAGRHVLSAGIKASCRDT